LVKKQKTRGGGEGQARGERSHPRLTVCPRKSQKENAGKETAGVKKREKTRPGEKGSASTIISPRMSRKTQGHLQITGRHWGAKRKVKNKMCNRQGVLSTRGRQKLTSKRKPGWVVITSQGSHGGKGTGEEKVGGGKGGGKIKGDWGLSRSKRGEA